MINKFVVVLNVILSFIINFFRKIHNNWPKLRKIFITVIFVVAFIFYIQSPDVKLQLGKTAESTILEHEKNADMYASTNDFENAISNYKMAVSIIISHKNLDTIPIDNDIQYRVCKKSADIFLKYSKLNVLDENYKYTGHMFIEGLNIQKKYFKDDLSIDLLIEKLDLAILQ